MITTWIDAINKGWYSTWTGLTASRVRKHFEPSQHTSMGHMKMISKGIRSTQPTKPIVDKPDEPEPPPVPITVPNEISKEMVKIIVDNKLDYQLAAPGDHQLVSAKRAI